MKNKTENKLRSFDRALILFLRISLTILSMILGIAATGLVTALSMSETALAVGFGGGAGFGGGSEFFHQCEIMTWWTQYMQICIKFTITKLFIIS
jgi:hypothetical protein